MIMRKLLLVAQLPAATVDDIKFGNDVQRRPFFGCFVRQSVYEFPIGNTLTGRDRFSLAPKEQPPRSLSGKRTGWSVTRRREALDGPPKEQARIWVNLSGTADGGGIW